jgi:hypothetical protein
VKRAAASGKNFVQWLDKFYGRYMARMESIISPAAETCRMVGLDVDAEAIAFEHCNMAHKALLELSGTVTADELAERVARETDQWEAMLPAEIVEGLADAEALAKQG